MFKRWAPALGVAALVALASTALAERMQSDSGYVIDRSVIASGGGRSTTVGGFVLNGTIGQPIAAVSTADNGTTLVGGFQIMHRPSIAAVRNWNLY